MGGHVQFKTFSKHSIVYIAYETCSEQIVDVVKG